MHAKIPKYHLLCWITLYLNSIVLSDFIRDMGGESAHGKIRMSTDSKFSAIHRWFRIQLMNGEWNFFWWLNFIHSHNCYQSIHHFCLSEYNKDKVSLFIDLKEGAFDVNSFKVLSIFRMIKKVISFIRSYHASCVDEKPF